MSVSVSRYPSVSIKRLSFFEKALFTSLGSFVLALSGSFSLPMYPVPVTLQSCAALVVGAALGSKLGPLAVIQTIFLGFLGFPVFAGGANSAVALSSPSAGYIYGFILAAYLAGLASEYVLNRKIGVGLAALAVAHQSIFLVGVLFLGKFLNVSVQEAVALGYTPFLALEAAKFVLAIFIIKPLLWDRFSKTLFVG